MIKSIWKTLVGSGVIVLVSACALYAFYWICVLVGMTFPLFTILLYGSKAEAMEAAERLAPHAYNGVHGMYFLAGVGTIAIFVLVVFALAAILIGGNELGHRLFKNKA